jgi:hypothetical protein
MNSRKREENWVVPFVCFLAFSMMLAAQTGTAVNPLKEVMRPALRPDLTIAISRCPGTAKPGQELGASFVVQATNSGGVAVKQVGVDIVLKKAPRCPGPVDWAVYSPNFSDGVLLKGGREFIDLNAGETKPVKLNGTNAIPADTPAGTYYLCAVVDSGNTVAESNENNNCACCRLVIEGGSYQPCGISLTSLTQTSGKPGDSFGMAGVWGDTQGTKIPCINKGSMNRLEVLHWSSTGIKVRIPPGLEPGLYKVGVYCNELTEGGSYSSGWLDFTVVE